jgi:hypothetical protein
MRLTADVSKKPGKLRAETKDKVIDFLVWFAVKGFYASCYTQLFGAYTAEDDARLTALQQQVHRLEELTYELSNELALLAHQNSTLLYRLDALTEPEEKDSISWSFDWQSDIEGEFEE